MAVLSEFTEFTVITLDHVFLPQSKGYRLIEVDSHWSGSFLGSGLSDVLAICVFVYYLHDSVVKTLC